MSIIGDIIYEREYKYCQELKDKFLKEMKEELDLCSIEWKEEFLNPKDYSPEFDYGNEDHCIWFNICLGKFIAIDDYQKQLSS